MSTSMKEKPCKVCENHQEKIADLELQLLQANKANSDLRTTEASLSLFKKVLDSSVTPITIADLTQEDEPIIYVNSAFEQLTGYSRYDVIGRNCRFLQGEETGQSIIREIKKAVANRLPFKGVIKNFRKDGIPFWNELSLVPIPSDNGEINFILGEQRDIRSLEKMSPKNKSTHTQTTAGFEGLVGASVPVQKLIEHIKSVSAVDFPVLIEGETGTGKELVARAIHKRSSRGKNPFIAINCAGISETLLTSQLFGHKRGSFTGAIDNAEGIFEAAHGGTLFLDEIGDMPMVLQKALLRVLQEKEITRIGENVPRKVDVRLIAATHRNMQEMVKDGLFREDLFYRIKVARIRTPSLREHIDDLNVLIQFFIDELNGSTRKAITRVSDDALKAMTSYHWPGNIRELRGALEFAFISCYESEIQIQDLPPEICPPLNGHVHFSKATSDVDNIEAALRQTQGNKAKAAKLLGISRATFFRHLAKFKKAK